MFAYQLDSRAPELEHRQKTTRCLQRTPLIPKQDSACNNWRVKGGNGQGRSGARILTMASNRINRGILRELTKRPVQWDDNRQARITPAGREMLFVAAIAEDWLRNGPDGGIDIDADEAETAVAALVDGWTSTIVHLLAAEPLTLPELGRALDTTSREDVDAMVGAMRDAGLVEARPSDGEGAAYAVTDWLRESIAPLAAAARCERRHSAAETPPVAPLDVEAAFLLTLPLLRLPAGLAGACRLEVELPESGYVEVGAIARVEDERIASVNPNIGDDADAWAAGTDQAWLEAVIEGESGDLALGGDTELAQALVDALHQRLFGT
jgi:DNA-binding HxlR family transcriptional regulator